MEVHRHPRPLARFQPPTHPTKPAPPSRARTVGHPRGGHRRGLRADDRGDPGVCRVARHEEPRGRRPALDRARGAQGAAPRALEAVQDQRRRDLLLQLCVRRERVGPPVRRVLQEAVRGGEEQEGARRHAEAARDAEEEQRHPAPLLHAARHLGAQQGAWQAGAAREWLQQAARWPQAHRRRGQGGEARRRRRGRPEARRADGAADGRGRVGGRVDAAGAWQGARQGAAAACRGGRDAEAQGCGRDARRRARCAALLAGGGRGAAGQGGARQGRGGARDCRGRARAGASRDGEGGGYQAARAREGHGQGAGRAQGSREGANAAEGGGAGEGGAPGGGVGAAEAAACGAREGDGGTARGVRGGAEAHGQGARGARAGGAHAADGGGAEAGGGGGQAGGRAQGAEAHRYRDARG